MTSHFNLTVYWLYGFSDPGRFLKPQFSYVLGGRRLAPGAWIGLVMQKCSVSPGSLKGLTCRAFLKSAGGWVMLASYNGLHWLGRLERELSPGKSAKASLEERSNASDTFRCSKEAAL